ncbi:DUF2853 family protein [Portibacter lacus]|uniref:DUF2853 family protein n=1 Tax=Portibacter lacus TaxID=1099794 RepID=A0AA37WDX3_9BACT|nr:DUF2853 family protein [Portibacter lacus]GLR16079.1 hypothetical protein GCM10007940_06940 [Portibacter lacus]
MSKFDEKLAFYKEQMGKLGIKVDDQLIHDCTKACGPSIYNKDAETVSGSDQTELDRVKKNYLIKKLGFSASDDLDGMVNYAVEKMGKSNRNKYRAIFYYLLSQKSGKSPA